MGKALIVYGSTTGNTESIALVIKGALEKKGWEVTCENASDATAEGLCDGYDVVYFGASAWGSDTIELQDDFATLYEDFDDRIKAKGKKAGTFASGDSSFEFFCGSADMIADKLKELGANVVDELKIEGDASGKESEIAAWAEKIAA